MNQKNLKRSTAKILHISSATGLEEQEPYAFVDNDVLSLLYNNLDLTDEFFHYCKDLKVRFLLDEFIKFEFLRGIFVPKEMELREAFLNPFGETNIHKELYLKRSKVAINLSRIYNHSKQAMGASIPDLLLAAHSSLFPKSFVITSNAKDYPAVVFEIKLTISYRGNDGHINTICFLQFSDKKYSKGIKTLAEIQEKYLDKDKQP